MKNYGTIFVILLFLVLLGIGIFALNEQLFLQGSATTNCPVPEIPEQNICSDGSAMVLVEGTGGCYEFSCQ